MTLGDCFLNSTSRNEILFLNRVTEIIGSSRRMFRLWSFFKT